MGHTNTPAHDLLAGGGPRSRGSARTTGHVRAARACGRATTPEVVREELATLAAHGCNVTRSFCYWPDFVPEPERLDADVLRRFADFLDAHVEAGLGTIPTFLVGHMSGENWDPPWRGGRDLYRDAWLVAQQAWLAGEIARRFGPHPAVVGWLVSNEMPLYGGPGHERGDRGLGAPDRRRRPRGRGRAADLARRRRLGRRGRPAPTTATRCGRSRRSSTSSGRTSTRWRTTRCASSSPPPSSASSPPASTGRSCSRSSGSPPTSPPTSTRPTTTGSSSTRRSSRARAAGSRGTTATTTTSATRIRTATTSSRCTSGSPTARERRSRSCTRWRGSRDSSPSSARTAGSGSPARSRSSSPSTSSGSCRSPSRPTGATSAPTCCQAYVAAREADLPVRALPRARRPARRTRGSSSRPATKLLTGARPRPAARARGGRRDGLSLVLRREHARTSAARGSPGSTRSSACGTRCGTASSTRSRATR